MTRAPAPLADSKLKQRPPPYLKETLYALATEELDSLEDISCF